MFGKFKEKLKNWAKKVSKETEEKVKEPEIKEPPEDKIGKKVKEAEKALKKIETQTETTEEKKESAILQETLKDLEEAEQDFKKAKELEPEKPGFFKKITSKVSKVTISEKAFEIYEEELKMLLLENNVAYEVADKVISKLKKQIIGKALLKKEVESEIIDTIKEIIKEILLEPFDVAKKIKENQEPYVILFCGINGTGKTTTIAKIAHHLQKQGLSCVLAAADTFRAASIEQIQKHAEKLNIKVIAHDYGTDPAAVAFDAVKYAKKNKINAVLIDTAGRMHSEKNLLKELEKISRVSKPNLKLFIGEAITGNDSIEQAKSFDWAIGIDGIVLTKADTDEKGGTALSLGFITKKPILYLGTGQEYDDIIPFNKNKFIEELGL